MKKEPFSIRRLLRPLKRARARNIWRQETRNSETSERFSSLTELAATDDENRNSRIISTRLPMLELIRAEYDRTSSVKMRKAASFHGNQKRSFAPAVPGRTT